MKKIVAVILTVFLLLNIASCGKNSFGGPEKSYGNYVVVLDADESKAKNAMVIKWHWDGNPENMVISVPDYFPDGVKVTSVGGATGSSLGGDTRIPFTIVIDETKAEEQSSDQVVFTVEIGKNVQSIYFKSSANPYLFYFVCDDSNPVLYSKDGKVYSKDTNKLYSGIPSGCYGDI